MRKGFPEDTKRSQAVVGVACSLPSCLRTFTISVLMNVLYSVSYFFPFFLLVDDQIQLSPFSHHHCNPHSHLPPSILSPLSMFIYNLFSSFPCYFPPPSPLVTVILVLISMSLVIFCLLVCFVDYVSLIGEIIWYFTTWLTSLSIMLSSSIHAVMKGRSSIFLTAA